MFVVALCVVPLDSPELFVLKFSPKIFSWVVFPLCSMFGLPLCVGPLDKPELSVLKFSHNIFSWVIFLLCSMFAVALCVGPLDSLEILCWNFPLFPLFWNFWRGDLFIRTPLIPFLKALEGVPTIKTPPLNFFNKKFYNFNFQHAFSPAILNLQPSFTYQNNALTLLSIKDWVCHPW